MARVMMGSYRLFRFTCGHVGRANEGEPRKASAFIRVAQIGKSPVSDVLKPCPECDR